MKKTNLYLLLAMGAFGVLALTNKFTATAADAAMPGCTMSGCCGGAMAMPMAGTTTNAIPDLLTTCPVSGEKLNGDMGKPLVFTYKGQEVKLCCKSCKKDFDKNPDKFIAKIRRADNKPKN